MQVLEHHRAAGNHDTTGSFSVQSVDQFQVAILAAQLAQAFDQAEIESAAAVDGKTRGFVDNQQVVVLQQQPSPQQVSPMRWHLGWRQAVSGMQWWNANLVTSTNPIVRFDATLVDSNFALAQCPV